MVANPGWQVSIGFQGAFLGKWGVGVGEILIL